MTLLWNDDRLIFSISSGCKRRIFDPNYLESLHRRNVDVAPVGIDHIDETGLTSTDGVHSEFDAIVLATGFDVQRFVVPMEVYGKNGKSLSEQWKESRGAQAYMGVYVHNFPNFGLLYVIENPRPFCSLSLFSFFPRCDLKDQLTHYRIDLVPIPSLRITPFSLPQRFK